MQNNSKVKSTISPGRFFHPAIFFFNIFLILTGLVNSQPRGGAGGLRSVQAFENGKIIQKPMMVQDLYYTIELFPGQFFEGVYYYWSNGDTITANLKLPPDVQWLSIDPAVFTSDSCSDIKVVNFAFLAPDSVGDYVTTIVDSNGNWPDTRVTCSVTNSPWSYGPYYVDLIRDTLNSDTLWKTFYYTDFSPGCADHYAPYNIATLGLETLPSVSWLEVPIVNYIPLNDSISVPLIFSNDTTGGYFTYLIQDEASYSHPTYYLYFLSSGATSVRDPSGEHLPENFSLLQNYPNPFNPSTVISYQLPVSGRVTLKVYDVLGREIALLVDEYKPAGKYDVNFDASGLASGVYFYRITAGRFSETKKMIILR